MDTVQVRRLKVIMLLSSVASLALLLMAAYEENLAGAWRQYQLDYRGAAVAAATSDTARAAAQAFPIEFRQNYLPKLDRIDRCTTCHIGIDDPRMADAEQPIRTHSGNLLEHHPLDKFGCTVCHDGQPRAVKLPDAHGEVEDWAEPLLRGAHVYTSCSRCHYEADVFGAQEDLYAGRGEPAPLFKSELVASVPGESEHAAAIARGKRTLLKSGCLGCHKYRGRGGALGPDITYVGDKGAHGFDFTNVHGEHTVENWLFEHFKNPSAVSSDSLMPDLDLSDQEASDLTLYMLSLHRKSMPADYTPVPPRRADEPASGAQLYGIFCSACHGADGHGNTAREYHEVRAIDAPPELMVPSLNHPDTLAVASDGYLRAIAANGRPNTNMLAWAKEGGLRPDEIDRIVGHIRSWQPPRPDMNAISAARGDARIGGLIYRHNCQACHGRDGEGGVGNSLNSPTFLAVASDEFLAQTIVEGRPNTAMPRWHEFNAQQVSDLIAYLRSWQPRKNDKAETLQLVSEAASGDAAAPGSARIGAILFQANCVTCHGQHGQGGLGPSLDTQEFLTVVDDAYLYETISRGRPGTGMPAWRHLSSEDIAALISFIRTWQTKPSRTLSTDRIVGDWDTGRNLYAGACASCHGQNAEGAIGPQLNNPVFLSVVTDAMLKQWVMHGKLDTPMRSFIKGEQGTVEFRERQIDDIVSYVRSLQFKPRVSVSKHPSGRPELGKLWFAISCSQCHGNAGEGASGPALGNPGFLHAASDGFLMATMALGRDGTQMRPVKKGPESILSLSSDQVNDVVAYLRSWEYDPPATGIAHRYVIPWDLERGRKLYTSICSGCHGIEGKGELDDPARFSAWAPNLNNEGFLAAATDGFLQATIVKGRSGTAMRPFGHGMQGVVDLTSDDVDDLVAFIRRWSKQPGLPITIPAEIKTAGEQNEINPSGARGAAETAGTSAPQRELPLAATQGPIKGEN